MLNRDDLLGNKCIDLGAGLYARVNFLLEKVNIC